MARDTPRVTHRDRIPGQNASMPARHIETLSVPADQLTPYPGNPKRHDGPALAESVTLNGQYKPVTARRLPDGRLQLLAGHGTTDAIALAGSGDVDVWLVEADDVTAGRIVAADNSIGARGGFDEPALLALLDEINAGGAGLAGTGYDEHTYAELIKRVGNENPFDGEGPGEFTSFGEDIATDHECPKCGYTWSGKA